MKTITIKLYEFDELSDSAKENARQWYRSLPNGFWQDCVIEDCSEIGKILGISDMKIGYSGFSSQGDGAHFTGHYRYAPGALKAIKTVAPRDTELHAIVKNLQDEQAKHFYKLRADVEHRGHYQHENSTDISVYDSRDEYGYIGGDAAINISEYLRDFMRWVYRSLEGEYNYQNSDGSVGENIVANEYTFTIDGERL